MALQGGIFVEYEREKLSKKLLVGRLGVDIVSQWQSGGKEKGDLG